MALCRTLTEVAMTEEEEMLEGVRDELVAQYAHVGNFHENRVKVVTDSGSVFHANEHGQPAYKQRYKSAGDFKNGVADVQDFSGNWSKIDLNGESLI